MNSKRSKGTGVETRIILNLLSDPVVIADQNGLLIMVNDAFGKATGLNPEELIGKHFTDLPIVDSRTKALLMEKWKKTMKGTPSEPYEVLFVTPAGEKRIVEMKASRIIYDGKTADLVILRDVTRRKEDAKRLKEYAKRMEVLVEEKIKETKESEEKLRRIVESSPDPIVVSSSDGKVLDCNPAALKTFGYSTKSEVIGRNVIEFFAEKERTRATENSVPELQNARNLEYIFQTKNGREFVGELSFCPVLQPSGKIACFVSTIKDLTERREKEKALRESEERFKQVAQNAEEWIWEVDAQGMYTYSSPLVEKILGYKPEEIVGKKHFYDLFDPEDQEQLKNTALKVFERKQPFHGFINKNIHSNGEVVWLSTSGVPILNHQGKLVGYRGVDTDITEFKKAQEALQASEKNYRAVINGMNDTAWVIGFDGSFIDVNDAAVKVLGYSREELRSGGIQKIDKNLTKSEVQGLIDCLPTVGIQVFETVHTSKDGKEVPVEICSSLVTYQGKQAILSIARDITERKKAEEAVRSAEHKFRNLFEKANDAFVYLDKFGKILDVNAKTLKIFGGSKDELLGKHFTKIGIFSVKNIPTLMRNFTKIVRGKEVTIELSITNKKQQQMILECSASLLKTEESTGIFVVVRDITERKKAEEIIRNAEEMYRQLFNTIPSGVAVYKDVDNGEDFVFVDFNKTAEKIENIHKQELLGKRVTEVFPGVKELGLFKVFQQVLRTGKAEYLPTGMYKDGRISGWRENWVYRLPNGAIVAVYNDTTERVKMQKKLEKYSRHLEETVEKRTRELKEANAKLLKSERLAAIGELAGMVGHDLRNPLTGIKNAAYYLIKKDQALDDNSKKMLEIIDSAVSRADKIIGDLQEYSREIHLDLARYSPKAILQEAVALVQIPDKVKIVDNMPNELLIMADEPKMIRVFMSIVKNAVDAMPGGGTLQIKSAQKEGNVEISFTDTGIGIPKETLKKLFSPLVTTKAQGMGFGLAICKRIIEAHQGSITVQSVEGKGSTVTVTIPIKPKLEDAGDPEWLNLPKSLRRRRRRKQQS
jgi:two-component system sensor histidine kinase/response regulator